MHTPNSYMTRALHLAKKGLYTTTPNPRVGCVIVDAQGEIVGEGTHMHAGEPHAEIHALQQAGERARGATVYVTLEPCAHFGRTPPCAQALIEAGVARVVVAMQDPNPEVSGRGLTQLHEAGIAISTGLKEREARALNEGFISRMTRNRPFVRIKIAATLDGKIALSNGKSQWITGSHARADVHHWRARSCAILTGIGTVLADNPRLTVRALQTTRQPTKIIIDSHLQTPPTAAVLRDGKTLIATTCECVERITQLTDQGAEILILPSHDGHPDLTALMVELGNRGMNEILTEAGPRLNGALVKAGYADSLLLYQAPILFGDKAQSMLNWEELTELNQSQRLQVEETRAVGSDSRILARFIYA